MTPVYLPGLVNGIQNKTPLGWQQVQPDFQMAARVHDHSVQDVFWEGLVYFPALRRCLQR